MFFVSYLWRLIVRILSGVKWWILRRYYSIRSVLGLDTLPRLREFVYLDNQALISLLASTTGGITEQKTTGQKERISSSITGGIGPVKANIGGQSEEYSEQTSRFVIQSNFKEFYEMREEELLISAGSEGESKPDFLIGDSINREDIDTISSECHVKSLDRGSLAELDVHLGSAEVFDYYRVTQAFEDVLESFSTDEELQKQLQQEGVTSSKARMLNELIDVLLAGLIPVQGELVDYGVVEGETNILVRKEWAESREIEYKECHAAGFIDEDNLWQDPTRVLFDDNKFTIYSRIDNPNVSKEWIPMKLVDVVDNVFSESAEGIKNFPELFKSTNDYSPQSGEQIIPTLIDDDLNKYLESIEEQNTSIEDKDEIVSRVLTEMDIEDTQSVQSRRDSLRELDQYLQEHIDGYEDWSNSEAEYDEFLEQQWQSDQDHDEASKSTESDIYYLETSFIAIYW